MRNAAQVREFFKALRNPFAWPGGYDVAIYLADGERICHPCAKENALRIGRATRDGERDGWAFMGADIHWEGAPESCCQCGAELPSEYGDPDAQEPTARKACAKCGAAIVNPTLAPDESERCRDCGDPDGTDTPNVPEDFEVRPLTTDAEKQAAKSLATCGDCGLSWDDAVPTAYTPAPSARCPFEAFHVEAEA